MRLLLAEDETELSCALCAILKHNNYSVDAVYNGIDAFDYAVNEAYDGIILDIMMPGLNGLQVLSELRKKNISTPILMLTAKAEIEDKITGLDAGADDYLAKPFNMGELLARIRSLTRRHSEILPQTLSFGDITLNKTSTELCCNDNKNVFLTAKEFQLLETLITHPGIFISTQQFMQQIWGYDSDAEINVVWVCISSIRKKLKALKSNVIIKANRGIGYRLEQKA